MSSREAQVSHVKCKVSASLLPNNLSSNGGWLAYVHRSEVQLVENRVSVLNADKAESIKVAYNEKDAITQTMLCKLHQLGDCVVIITTTGIIHIYDESGTRLLHVHKLSKSQVALSARESVLRGIAHDGKQTLFIGTGSGDILVFSVSTAKLSLVRKLEGGHRDSVSTLVYSSSPSCLLSGDESGVVCAWVGAADSLSSSSLKPLFPSLSSSSSSSSPPPVVPSPVTSADVGHGVAAVAFATGHIRLFNLSSLVMTVEVVAHTRCINAIQIHPDKPVVGAVSEDTFISVWSLPTDKSPRVTNLLMQSPAPALLTGLRFVAGDLIAVTAYDSRFIFSIPTPSLV